MSGAIYRALGCYYNKEEWNKLMLRGIKTDNSWENSANKYIQLYYDAMNL